jgi:hypothetical protein
MHRQPINVDTRDERHVIVVSASSLAVSLSLTLNLGFFKTCAMRCDNLRLVVDVESFLCPFFVAAELLLSLSDASLLELRMDTDAQLRRMNTMLMKHV